MRVSQLIHAMDRSDIIVIDDYNAPVFKNRIYCGEVRGIKRDDPINKMHVSSICADGDVLLVLAEKPRWKGATDESKTT